MDKLIRLIKIALLRHRLAGVADDIDEIEHFRQHSQEHLDKLTRAAANLRAEIWFSENPRPAVGTTLRCLQGRR